MRASIRAAVQVPAATRRAATRQFGPTPHEPLVVEGDMFCVADPATWWSVTESVLGTTFPVFISRGNHDDSSWSGYLPKAAEHLAGATRIAGAHDANYKTAMAPYGCSGEWAFRSEEGARLFQKRQWTDGRYVHHHGRPLT